MSTTSCSPRRTGVEAETLELVERPAFRLPGQRRQVAISSSTYIPRAPVIGQQADQFDSIDVPRGDLNAAIIPEDQHAPESETRLGLEPSNRQAVDRGAVRETRGGVFFEAGSTKRQ